MIALSSYLRAHSIPIFPFPIAAGRSGPRIPLRGLKFLVTLTHLTKGPNYPFTCGVSFSFFFPRVFRFTLSGRVDVRDSRERTPAARRHAPLVS